MRIAVGFVMMLSMGCRSEPSCEQTVESMVKEFPAEGDQFRFRSACNEMKWPAEGRTCVIGSSSKEQMVTCLDQIQSFESAMRLLCDSPKSARLEPGATDAEIEAASEESTRDRLINSRILEAFTYNYFNNVGRAEKHRLFSEMASEAGLSSCLYADLFRDP